MCALGELKYNFAYAYCARKNIVDSDEFDVNTLAGVMKIKITDRRDFSVRVDMGSPVFDNKAIAAADGENCFGREISALGVTAKIYSFFRLLSRMIFYLCK